MKCPTYATQKYGDVPVLDVSASFDEASGKWAAFVVNRRMDASEPVEFDLRGLGADAAVQVVQVSGSDPKAANSFEQPYAVAPANLGTRSVQAGKLTLTLPPLSFTTIHN